ncbi:sirohydrochlorin chelatase [Corynebacterium mayonis]|uniref:sirohydrochlorin chelatase n=1 Tax=Corynebacterium mayonis TaxID=3062461 RepID=UPI00313FFB01
MTALITLSHGSRHPGAQRGIKELTAHAAADLGVPGWDSHLEFNSPDLLSAVDAAHAAGVERAVVVPLLFTRAFHATHDVPAALAAAAARGVELHLAQGLGQGADIAELLAGRVAEGAHTILYPVGTSHAQAAAETTQLGQQLSRLTGQGTTVVPATGKNGLRGNEGIEAVAKRHNAVHLVPLFVTEGLLLDKAMSALDAIAARTGASITASPPLGVALSRIVAARHRATAVTFPPTER